MDEIAGAFRLDGGVDPAIVDRLRRSLAGMGTPRGDRDGGVAMFSRRLRRPEGATALSPSRSDNGAMVVADCRLDEPNEIVVALGLEGPRRWADLDLVTAACNRWGSGAAARLNGSFAFAHWDAAANRLVLARDALGTRPLFYVDHPQGLFFASTIQSLLTLPIVARDLDELVLAQYLTIEPQDQERTIYRGIFRVPPGGMIVADRHGVRVSRYWTLDDVPPVRFRRDEDYVAAARALLDRAVGCRLPASGKVATTLSGGLDSAGVTATVARLRGDRRLDAFLRVPGADHPYQVMDERALANAVAARYSNIDLTVIDENRLYDADVEPESEAGLFDVPRGRSLNASWFQPLVDRARDMEVEVMLTGGCGNLTLSFDGQPNFMHDLVTGHPGVAWRTMVSAARDRRQSVPRFLAAHLVRPLVPRELQRWRTRRSNSERSPWAAYSMVSDDFLAELDYASASRRSGHDTPFAMTMTMREHRLRALQSQVNRDKGATARRRAVIEMRDPYADRRLVEFTLGIPERQFWHAGVDRWLARRVLADRLPREITDERRRGAQCPEWYTIVSARRDGLAAAIERIARSPLASRVVDVPRMKALLDNWPKDAEAAKPYKQIYGRALARGISIGGFLRRYEGGNG